MRDKIKIDKILNNSAILGSVDNRQLVIIGKGIAFGKKINDYIELDDRIEKTFESSDTSDESNKIKKLVAETISSISELKNMDIDSKKLISFTDHILAMYSRILTDNCIANPFVLETKVLYGESYKFSLLLGEIIFKKTGVEIPESELSYLALHFQNMFEQKKSSDLMQLNKIIVLVKDFLEEKYGFSPKEEDVNYARFLTHLRFLIHRIENNEKIDNSLVIGYKSKDKEQAIAKGIVKIIEEEMNQKISQLEIGLLEIHIARFIS